MNFFAILALLAPAASAVTVSLTFDGMYATADQPLSTFSCPGLFGAERVNQLAAWPNVTATAFIERNLSPNCGTCWQVTYQGRSINLLAIDHAPQGFTASPFTVNWLTSGTGITNGRVDVDVTQIDPSECHAPQ
jgi:hypothetical protein